MRCSKCGYISFDGQDNCKKCRKPVETAELLEGVIFAIEPPLFLGLDSSEDEVMDYDDTDLATTGERDTVVEISMDDNSDQDIVDIEIDFGEDDNQQFSLELDLPEDDQNSEPPDFDESRKEEQIENDIKLDFTNIDISDLAPSPTKSNNTDMDNDANIEFAELPPPSATESKSGSALDDLLIDDLDLNAPSPLVAGSKSGSMLIPSLKTGTALDDFEVDLGELIADKK